MDQLFVSKDPVLRDFAFPQDVGHIHALVSSLDMFTEGEITVAVELIMEYLLRGEASGYHFLFAEAGDAAIGYACFGHIPCTKDSFDLYWIAVYKEFQGKGIGSRLLAECEKRIRALGGRRIYIETSSRQKYSDTREFYLHKGYTPAAQIQHFYAENDDKVIFVKVME